MARRIQTAAERARTGFSGMSPEVLLPAVETAAVAGLSPSWLKADRLNAAKTGAPLRGPRPTIVEGMVRYAVVDIREWLEAQRANSAVISSARGGRQANPGGRPKGSRNTAAQIPAAQ